MVRHVNLFVSWVIHKGRVVKSNRNCTVHKIVVILVILNLKLFMILRVNVENKLKVLESI